MPNTSPWIWTTSIAGSVVRRGHEDRRAVVGHQRRGDRRARLLEEIEACARSVQAVPSHQRTVLSLSAGSGYQPSGNGASGGCVMAATASRTVET